MHDGLQVIPCEESLCRCRPRHERLLGSFRVAWLLGELDETRVSGRIVREGVFYRVRWYFAINQITRIDLPERE